VVLQESDSHHDLSDFSTYVLMQFKGLQAPL
jgi:hypothetical protein